MNVIQSTLLLAAVTAGSGTGGASKRSGNRWSYHGVITGTGAVAATVTIQVSNNGTNWETWGTLTLSGTTTGTDFAVGDTAWAHHRCTWASLTGTGAALTVTATGV